MAHAVGSVLTLVLFRGVLRLISVWRLDCSKQASKLCPVGSSVWSGEWRLSLTKVSWSAGMAVRLCQGRDQHDSMWRNGG
ncbi:hypothetical protein M758_8G044200 [Ceratodon purpureus]|nr:hypothetical protein M758_8G044200 [Ceratodon purpureus]